MAEFSRHKTNARASPFSITDRKIRAVCEFNAISIFIKNDNVPEITSNEADANVEDCWYDYYITNNGTIEEFEKIVKAFYYNILMKL